MNNSKGNTMTKYNDGDLIEAVKGETIIRRRLETDHDLLWLPELRRSLPSLLDDGFTITVIEKAEYNEGDPFAEMFPGTLTALNALTIRKATP